MRGQSLETRLTPDSNEFKLVVTNRVTTAKPVPNKRIRFRTIASNTGPRSGIEPLSEESISPIASCHAMASLRSRVRRAVSVSWVF